MNWNEIIKPFISKKLEEREIEIMREQIIKLLENLIKAVEEADSKDIPETILLAHKIRANIEQGFYDTNKKWSKEKWRKLK